MSAPSRVARCLTPGQVTCQFVLEEVSGTAWPSLIVIIAEQLGCACTLEVVIDSPRVLPMIDLASCSACGLCVQLCPTTAVELRGGKAAVVRPEDCTFCEICESYCPEGAIGRPFKIVFAPRAVPGQ